MIDEKTRAAQKDANMGLGRQTAAALEAIVDQLVLLNANLAALTRAAETASRAGGATPSAALAASTRLRRWG